MGHEYASQADVTHTQLRIRRGVSMEVQAVEDEGELR